MAVPEQKVRFLQRPQSSTSVGNNAEITKAPQITSLGPITALKTDRQTALNMVMVLFNLEAEYSRDTRLDDRNN